MIVCLKDGVIWIRDSFDLTEDERTVLNAVSDALPGKPPERIRVNDVCEYERIDDGYEGPIFGRSTYWVEYSCKVQAPTSDQLYSQEKKS